MLMQVTCSESLFLPLSLSLFLSFKRLYKQSPIMHNSDKEYYQSEAVEFKYES